MTPQELCSRIRKLRETAPVTAEFERVLTKRGLGTVHAFGTQLKRNIGWDGCLNMVRPDTMAARISTTQLNLHTTTSVAHLCCFGLAKQQAFLKLVSQRLGA
jgi:hypothetical protein